MGEAVELVRAKSPDVVLVDLDLPDGHHPDPLQAAKRIKAERLETKVLVLTAAMNLDLMSQAAAAGACGFLPKSSEISDLLRAVRTAKDGGMFVEASLLPAMISRIHQSMSRPIGGGATVKALTPRERSVLRLLGSGLDPARIASELGISVSTARVHVRNLHAKFGTHSQLETVVAAARAGLLPDAGQPG